MSHVLVAAWCQWKWCQDVATTVWVFASIVDAVKMGFLDRSAFSTRSLSPQTGNKKGVLDLFIMKKQVRDYILNSWLQTMSCPADVRQKLEEYTASHAVYRTHVRGYTDADADDGTTAGPAAKSLAWKKGWPQSAELALQLIEGVAFDVEFDASLKNGVKNRRSPVEMLEYAQIKEKIGEITEAFKQEQAQRPGSGETPAAVVIAVVGAQAATAPEAIDLSEEATDTKEQEDKEVFEKRWSTYAQRLVDSHVTLLPEPQTESQLVTMLSACEVMKTKGNRGADYMGALWLTGLGSEALSDPHCRGAPFHKARLMKLGKAFLKARHQLVHKECEEGVSSDALGPGGCFVAMDNQKPGLIPKLTEFLKVDGKKTFEKKVFTCVYTYDSVAARRLRVKGVATVCQTETLIVATAAPLVLPQKPHKHYHGQNTGSVISPIKLLPFQDCWALSFAEKKLLYGKLRLPTGGKADDDDDEDDGGDGEVPPTVGDDTEKPKVRGLANIEPVSYHSLPMRFFDDVCDALCLKEPFIIITVLWRSAIGVQFALPQHIYFPDLN